MAKQEYEWEDADKNNPWGKKRKRGTHCTKGHEFTPENTFIRAYDKARVCRECRKQYAREKYQRNKELNNGVARKRNPKPIVVDFDSVVLTGRAQELYNELHAQAIEIETACRIDPTFYIDTPEDVELDKAEEMCYNCPLLKLCYDFAVASNQEWGVWGGVNFTREEMKYGNEPIN